VNRAKVISIVNAKTENALVDVVDFNDLFADVLQELCAEHRFTWRKKRLTFSTVLGIPTYDLTAITTAPVNAGAFVEEITRVGRVDGTTMCDVYPITSDKGLEDMLLSTSSDKPTVYARELNDLVNDQVLILGPTPNGIYTMHVFFWAMPNPDVDSSDETIYIVPSSKHHILVTGLEKEVWRLKYGQQDPKYITALNLYNKKVAAEKNVSAFSTSKETQLRRTDNRAVRSTR
jgi:hypothetical protein